MHPCAAGTQRRSQLRVPPVDQLMLLPRAFYSLLLLLLLLYEAALRTLGAVLPILMRAQRDARDG